MAHLSISVLGQFGIAQDGESSFAFESDKVRALLAYLVVEGGHLHRRESLAGLLWPDCSEQAARHNLSQALFNLRKVLGDAVAVPPFLHITREAIAFNQDSACSVDLHQFNTAYSVWEKSQSQGTNVTSLLENMVGLYRGEFLQGFDIQDSAEFEEWILVQRAAVHHRIMRALTGLANEHEKRGNFQAVQRACCRQLELDPWREEVHGQLMRLLALDGQRSAALAQYETCRKILTDALGVEPSTKLRELYQQISQGTIQPRNETPTQIPTAPVQKLPLSLMPFWGRKQELAELARMLADPQCRCISLVGPGGMGKTRLALEIAERNQQDFTHGAAFIPLVSVGSAEAAVVAVASAIGFSFYGPIDPKIQLLHALANKSMLLILDNVEHLLVEEPNQCVITDLIIEILQQAPQVKLLITSREALNMGGEWIYEVQGLDYPRSAEPMETANQYSAVALFVQHARRVRSTFELDGEHQRSITRLCRLVEGMPLAIELAAAWVRILPVEEIVAQIEGSLDFLNTQARNIPERHRNMRAVFEPSWQLLTLEEKQVLSRLSVFRAGFGRQAAEQVAGASLRVLSSLVTRSLVRRSNERSIEACRYELHELVRQYAAAKLAENPPEWHRVQERHCLYYLGLLEEKDALLHSAEQKVAMNVLTGEIHNIRAAWDWAAKNQQNSSLYRASTALRQLFELRNWFKEGEQTFRSTAEAMQAGGDRGPEDTGLEIARIAMLVQCGFFMFRQGKSTAAYDTLVPCVARLSAIEPLTGASRLPLIYSLTYLGIVCWELGRFSEAVERLQEGLRLAQNFEQRWYEAHISEFLGIVANDRGEYAQARQYLSHALAIFRQLGDQIFTAHTLGYLGRTLLGLEETPAAEKLLGESLNITRAMEYPFGSGLALDALGQAAYAQGNAAEALLRFSESASLFQEIGDHHRLARTLNHQGLASLALNRNEEAHIAFRTALALAQNGGLLPTALAAIAGLATLQTRQESTQQTLELVLSILRHPAAQPETKDLMRSLQTELEAVLPLQAVKAAHICAEAQDLNEVFHRFAAWV